VLKVFPKNPGIVFKFDKLLKDAGFLFKKSKPKTFEEITSLKKMKLDGILRVFGLVMICFTTKNKRLSLKNIYL